MGTKEIVGVKLRKNIRKKGRKIEWQKKKKSPYL